MDTFNRTTKFHVHNLKTSCPKIFFVQIEAQFEIVTHLFHKKLNYHVFGQLIDFSHPYRLHQDKYQV